MAETLKVIWVVERRTDVSDWTPMEMWRTRNEARHYAEDYKFMARDMRPEWTYRVAKYVRA